jgi:acetyltransferase-like isoleucine patch superfamily enzyme
MIADLSILHHHPPGLALGAAPARAMLSLRHRGGLLLARWGYGKREGIRATVAGRTRGRMRMRGIDERGRLLALGAGVKIRHFFPHTTFSVGDRVTLFEHVQIKLEAAGARIRLGDGTEVSERSEIIAHESVSIGSDCLISWEVLIMDGDYHHLRGSEPTAPIVIADRVWIGARATILKGVTVGEGAVVGAGAVVTADVPPRTLVAGSPARVVRSDVEWEA